MEYLRRINSNQSEFDKILACYIETELKFSRSFRYFQSRDIRVLKNHLITVLIIENSKVLGYGHIDKEKFNWLGIYVSNGFRNRGLGNQLMNYLLKESKKQSLDRVRLTVDNENIIALVLYKKLGFESILNNDEFTTLELII